MLASITASTAAFLLPSRQSGSSKIDDEQWRAIVDSLDMGLCIIEMQFDVAGQPIDYVFVEVNSSFGRQTGLTDVIGKSMRSLRPQHEQHWFDIYGKIAKTGEPSRFIAEAAALGRWYDVNAFRVSGEHENRVAILFDDITERRRLQQRHELLNQEIDHRARNLLTLMAGLVRMSAADTVEDYKRKLLGRLDALGRSQKLLSEKHSEAVDFTTLVRNELEAYETEQRRVSTSGPAVMVDEAAVQCLAMTLHELATNAVKYGALSASAGVVSVTWQAHDERLHVTWSETGGPPVASTRRRGVGTKVIERCIGDQLAGQVEFDWLPQGLTCRFQVPLKEAFLASAAAAQ
jgi:two-component system CheB/CheR fusion protein